MCGRDGGLENRAQERTSVGHGFTAIRNGSIGCRLSILLPQKKTPAKRKPCGGCLVRR
jgi:hypothetical protein